MNNYSILLIIAIICHSSTINPDIKFPNCENNKGEEVTEGDDFIPPDDECIHCMCYKGEAKFCGTIRCDEPPPLDCKKWTEICCNYTCHDDEFNEMADVNADHPYDSPENVVSPFNQFKHYASKLWNRIINGKNVQAQVNETLITVRPTDIPVVIENETIISVQSTTISDIPDDIYTPPLNEIPKIVKDEKPKRHNARNCLDVYDIEVEEGQFYLPGPSTCLMCRCISGRPRFCTTMECEAQPPKDCTEWIEQDCCEYTCKDTKDSKENFFLNRWIDKWFRKTTIPPPKEPYHENPL